MKNNFCKLPLGKIKMDVKGVELQGINAVKKLRRDRLSRGDFFMINLNSLPASHCYLEFPQGVAKLVAYESGAKDFTVIRELDTDEYRSLLRKFDLELLR
jgi:hypothetical protein